VRANDAVNAILLNES